MADIFEEVEESLRQDKATVLWKKCAPFIIGGCVLFIGAVGGVEFWRWQQQQAVESGAVAYAAAMKSAESTDLDAATAAFAEIAAGGSGYSPLASHVAASLEKDRGGDPDAVVAHLKSAADLDDGYYSDLALLRIAYTRADSAELAELETLVAPLIARGGAMSAMARELVAAKALAEGDIERARGAFQTLSLDIDAPAGMAQRVQQVLVTLPAPVATPEPAPEPATGEASPGPQAQPDQATP